MSVVYTDITLVNATDVVLAQDGLKKESEIRKVMLSALVDTGSWSLVINEDVRERLGLHKAYDSEIEVAGGAKIPCYVTEPVTIHWKDRRTSCEAYVLKDEKPVLLGALPLEGLDLTINPKREVIGAHGDKKFVFAK
jgi:clan AA aspartic protease